MRRSNCGLTQIVKISQYYIHWEQSKRHRLWFSTKTVQLLINENSCKQHDPHPQIEFDFVEKNIYIKSGLRWASRTF